MKALLIGGCLLTLSSMMYLLVLCSGLYGSVVSAPQGPTADQGTLARVQGAVLRVGYTQAPGAGQNSAARPQGLAPALITGFARQLAARVEWVPGNEQQLYHALKNRKIDLLIGNLTPQTPGQDDTALTRPHLENANYAYVGYKPARRAAFTSSSAARLLKPGRNGLPPRPRRLAAGSKPLKPNPVIAVPAGEKAWLIALETYLHQHQVASATPR